MRGFNEIFNMIFCKIVEIDINTQKERIKLIVKDGNEQINYVTIHNP